MLNDDTKCKGGLQQHVNIEAKVEKHVRECHYNNK